MSKSASRLGPAGDPGQPGGSGADDLVDGQVARRMSTGSLKNSWRLKYQDFVPAKTGSRWTDSEPIQKLIDRANEWLSKNEDVQVRMCETITWMSHEQSWLGDGNQMILSKTVAEGKSNHFLRGLRLWLIPAAGGGGGQQLQQQAQSRTSAISYMDVVPEEKEVVADLIDKINRKIKTRQLRGRILSLETVAAPMVSGRLQSSVTRWSESVDTDSPYAFILRVYYDRDASSRLFGCDTYSVGIRDFVPSASEFGYESFDALIEKTNDWLKDQSDLVITNMQSLMVQRNDGPHASIGSDCFYTMPGISSPEPTEFFRILRIAHLRFSGDKVSEIPIVYPFTFETFTPELVRLPPKDQTGLVPKERLEKMKEAFSKVIAFLRNSGAEVVCSETVMNPIQMYIDESDSADAHHDEDDDNIRFLFTIRLFLTGQINQLTDGSTRMIKRASIQPVQPPPPPPETSDLLPSSDKLDEDNTRSPLFLRHVVGRQYKYRWLILAVSAFTCMTIIVVLSVVYSNR